MVRLKVLYSLLLITALGWAPGSFAQEADAPTVEEITEAFKKQKTRGLVIVPNAAAAAAQGTETAAAGSEAAATTVTSTDPAVSTAETTSSEPTLTAAGQDAAEVYNPVELQQQINLRIAFDFDSAALRSDQKPKLVAMCESMKLMEGTVFQIIGHTDSAGTSAYNEKLSLLRAQEVRRHLISTCGIGGGMLKAIGMGEVAPFDQANPRGDVNRRVEFQALG